MSEQEREHQAAAGETVEAGGDLLGSIIEGTQLAPDTGTRDALSAREREVVRLVAAGETGPEIAEHLHISHATVRTHVRNAMAKVGARSRAHLVAKALGDGHALP
jgi:DNA-binding CsgD family transcriptional regulator